CSALRARRRVLGADGQRAAAPARPVNNRGGYGRSGTRGRDASAADGAPEPASAAPDDRSTAIIPGVTDDPTLDLRDPIEAVKAALDRPPQEHEQTLSAGGPPPGKGEESPPTRPRGPRKPGGAIP